MQKYFFYYFLKNKLRCKFNHCFYFAFFFFKFKNEEDFYIRLAFEIYMNSFSFIFKENSLPILWKIHNCMHYFLKYIF